MYPQAGGVIHHKQAATTKRRINQASVSAEHRDGGGAAAGWELHRDICAALKVRSSTPHQFLLIRGLCPDQMLPIVAELGWCLSGKTGDYCNGPLGKWP